MSNQPLPVGSLMLMGFPGADLSPETLRVLRVIRPGGVVLFLRNVESSRQLKELTRRLHAELDPSPVIAIDLEGGTVNRFRYIVGELPTIGEMLARGIHPGTFGRVIGRLLCGHGVDMDFAPVLDLELFGNDVDNALRERCWGRTADEVAERAGAFLVGLQSAGVTGCAKHFPGLGGARLDSHEELPTIERSVIELGEDLFPYQAMLPQLRAVMVGHGHYPSLTGDTVAPASLSARVMTGMLREELKFDGLVLTDDMEMGAITRNGSVGEAVVSAVEAGADGVLVCHLMDNALAAHKALTKAVESGRISVERLALAVQRLRACRGNKP